MALSGTGNWGWRWTLGLMPRTRDWYQIVIDWVQENTHHDGCCFPYFWVCRMNFLPSRQKLQFCSPSSLQQILPQRKHEKTDAIHPWFLSHVETHVGKLVGHLHRPTAWPWSESGLWLEGTFSVVSTHHVICSCRMATEETTDVHHQAFFCSEDIRDKSSEQCVKKPEEVTCLQPGQQFPKENNTVRETHRSSQPTEHSRSTLYFCFQK